MIGNMVDVVVSEDILPEDFGHDLLNEFLTLVVGQAAVAAAQQNQRFVRGVEFVPGEFVAGANLAQQGFSGRKHGASMMLFHKLTMEQYRGSCRVIENFFRISPSRSPARTARATPGTY